VRDVEVHRAELLGSGEDPAGIGQSAHYEIECSAGTYVRTLIETLDDAYCSSLRRVAVGPFRVEEAGRELPIAAVAELVPAVGDALR
jgi:tRNA pseudouridine55 synthase